MKSVWPYELWHILKFHSIYKALHGRHRWTIICWTLDLHLLFQNAKCMYHLTYLIPQKNCDAWMTSHYAYTQSLLQCWSNAAIHCIKYITKIPMDCWPVISVEGSRGRTATVENPKITHVNSFFSKTSCHTQTNNNEQQIISPYINPRQCFTLSLAVKGTLRRRLSHTFFVLV